MINFLQFNLNSHFLSMKAQYQKHPKSSIIPIIYIKNNYNLINTLILFKYHFFFLLKRY